MLAAVAVPDGSHVADHPPEIGVERMAALKNRLAILHDLVFHEEPAEHIAYRWPMGAVLCGIVPGAAQIYTGRKWLALLFAVPQAILLAMVVLTFFKPSSNWWILAWHLANLASAAEGYQAALRINGRFTLRKFKLATFFALMVSTGFVLMTSQWIVWLMGFRLVAIMSEDLGPAFEDGDRVLVCNWPLWFNNLPDRGDIIYYTQEPLRVEFMQGEDSSKMSGTARRTFAVVNGEPGDTLAWKDGEPPKLNGAPFTDNILPINPAGLTRQFNLTVPEGRVAALISTKISEFSLGPSWGGTMPTPREMEARHFIIFDFEKTNVVDPDKTIGVVVLRYNPPERRTWFGRRGGVQRGK